MVDKPGNGENAGRPPDAELELTLASYLKPVLELYDFQHLLRPRLDERTGELVGFELTFSHPTWPLGVRLLAGRLWAIELATGILAVVDSHDKAKGGE